MLGVYDGGAMILGMGGFEDNAVCNLGTTAMFRCAYSNLYLIKVVIIDFKLMLCFQIFGQQVVQ